MKKILYIISGRCFHFSTVGRKIHSITDCWRQLGYEVVTVFGGDIELEPEVETLESDSSIYGNPDYYNAWYRKNIILLPLVNTLSEYRDIVHDHKLEKYLQNLIENWKPDLIWERSSRLHIAGVNVALAHKIPLVLIWPHLN